MREILFRGKDLRTGEWVFGSFGIFTELDGSGPMQYDIMAAQEESSHPVNPDTVGQYTGMTDKNGRKIFEGDILKGEYELDGAHGEFHEAVLWEGGSWAIQECGYDYTADILTDETAAECVIVGNIHDNPELMEVQE